jgi:hypothetical protein
MSFPFFFDGTSNIFINGSLGIGTTQPLAPFHSAGISYFVGNVGIGTTTPRTKLEVHSQDGVLLPRGTTEQRPSTSLRGYIRYNTDTSQFEGLGAADQWGSLGGVKSTDQTTYISAELTPGANDCNLRFYNNNSLNMILNPTGNLGIGTTLPKHTLDVNGNISASNYFGNASGLSNITGQLMFITGGGLRVANQKLVVDGDLFLGGQIFGGCNTSVFTGGATMPPLISPNVVTSSNIVDGSITFPKLDPSAYNFQWMAITGGGLRTSQKVVIDSDLIIAGNIYNASNQDLNSLYPGGAILGCNIGVGVINTSNLVDRSVTVPKVDFSSNLPVVFGGNVGIGSTATPVSTLCVTNNASFGTYNTTVAPANSLIISGNIGIGTTTPQQKLDVQGTTLSSVVSVRTTTITSSNAGDIQFDGTAFYGTPVANSRGSIPTQQYYILTSDRSLVNQTAAQNIFPVTFYLSANTYYYLHAGWQISGTNDVRQYVTVTNNQSDGTIFVIANTTNGLGGGSDAASGSTQGIREFNTAVQTANTNTSGQTVNMKGHIKVVTAAQITFQCSAGGSPGTYTTKSGSYVMLWPMGPSSVTSLGNIA